jgi:hypothetical protein
MKARTMQLQLIALSLLIASAVGVSPSFAQEDTVPEEPTLTVRLSPQEPYLQEQIVQVIRLIAPHPFEEIVLDLPPVEGAETITIQKPKNRKFETYGGEGYIYETSRAIFPKQSGRLQIPAVRISGSIAIGRNEQEAFALRQDATSLDVLPPDPSFSEDWWLVAGDVEISEAWSKPLEELRVGDHVMRKIDIAVSGVTGAHLPELEQGRSNGLTILSGRTERKTEIESGRVVGKISRTFDIRIDADQPINISPVRLVWWNTNTEREIRSAAPATRIEPLPRDVETLVASVMEQARLEQERGRLGLTAAALGLTTVIGALLIWLLRAKKRSAPEDAVLLNALSKDDTPKAAIGALLTWGEASFPDQRPMNLGVIGRELGPDAERHLSRLQGTVFDQGQEPIDTAPIIAEIVRLAEEKRSRSLGSFLTTWTDQILGAKSTLPTIDGSPSTKSPT